MEKILFIGSFLSLTRGTKGVAESIAEYLLEDKIEIKLVSRYENKFLRILDILFSVLFYKGNIVHIDVFSGSAFNIAVVASRIAKFRKKYIILSLHGGKLVEFSNERMYRVKSLFKMANYIQTPSKFLQVHFDKRGFEIQYLPNPLNLKNFPISRNEVKPHSLLWVRGFSSIYNPEIPIKVLGAMKKKFPNCTLTMIGPDRGLLSVCKKLVHDLDLENSVNFVGSVPNNELYIYYQTHAVFLNTTSYESFGVAVIEAASCGIPIVSNNVGEIPYLWDDKKNILMVDNNNIDRYVSCVSLLFEDHKEAINISMGAREKALSFDWHMIKPSWLKLLNYE